MLMTSTQLAYAEKRMKQKWYDLVMAEQQGAPTPALERLYSAYMLAVEEYNRCSVASQQCTFEQRENARPDALTQKQSTTRTTGNRKKAS